MQTHIICLLLFLPSVYMIACPVAQFCSFAPGTCPNATQNIFTYGNYSVDLGDFNLIGLDNITVLVATIGGKVASGGQILISNQADFGNEVSESAGSAVTGIVVGNLSIIPNIYNNDNSTIIIRPSNAKFLVGGSFPANYTQNKNQIVQPCGSDRNCLNSSFSQIRTYWRSVSSSIYSYAILGSVGLQKYNTPYTITLDQDGNGVLLINCKADSVLQTLLFKFGVFSLINKVQLASTCRSDALYVLTTPDSSATIAFPSFSPNVILNFPYASFVSAYDVFQEAALVLAPYGQFLGPVTFTTPFRSQVVAASISVGRIVAPRTCSTTTPAPSTTGSSASTTASTGTCTNGYSRCTTSETYQTCNRGTWGPDQSCQQNLTCKPSGNFIYCT